MQFSNIVLNPQVSQMIIIICIILQKFLVFNFSLYFMSYSLTEKLAVTLNQSKNSKIKKYKT